MMTALSAFLIVHGLLRFAIWMPHPNPEDEKPPPFVPDHSRVLTATHAPETAIHQLSVALAVGSAAGYVLAGLGVAFSTGWVVPVAIASALLGLCLKAVFFHPWLSVGVLLDLVVLSAAIVEWPVALT